MDPTSDFAAVCDGLEAVTLCRRGSIPGGPGTVIPHALRRQVTTREAAASNGKYTANDVTWHLPAAELHDAPRLGDVVLSGEGCQWTVLDVQRTTLGSRWRCTARNATVVYGLDDCITIVKAIYRKGAGGAAEPTWLPWKTGVRARIQPAEMRVGSQHEAREATTRCQIFVAEELVLDQTHRIQAADGTLYKVLGTSRAQRIGELLTIDAEVTPWP